MNVFTEQNAKCNKYFSRNVLSSKVPWLGGWCLCPPPVLAGAVLLRTAEPSLAVHMCPGSAMHAQNNVRRKANAIIRNIFVFLFFNIFFKKQKLKDSRL